MTMAEFFIIRPHGPNCWMGLGAFRLLVLLQKYKQKKSIKSWNKNENKIEFSNARLRVNDNTDAHTILSFGSLEGFVNVTG